MLLSKESIYSADVRVLLESEHLTSLYYFDTQTSFTTANNCPSIMSANMFTSCNPCGV
jgi:hypothetical protein